MPEDLRAKTCPFCPTSDEMPDEFDLHLLSSRFPVVSQSPGAIEGGAYGQHQVYVYTSDHQKRIPDFEVAKISALFELLATETSRMMSDPLVKSVYIFEVFGDHYGPTVDHAHGQILGLPFVPRRLAPEKECSPCSAGDQNRFYANELATASIPSYARYPFESLVVPDRHVGTLAELTSTERDDLADALIETFRAFRAYHGELPPYIMSLVQHPPDLPAGHLRVEILPLHSVDGRYKRPGGLEVGLGLYTNPLGTNKAVEIMRSSMTPQPSTSSEGERL